MQPMAPLNPYQSPRALDGQSKQRPWFALPRVFPKNRVERLLIVFPLVIALLLAAHECARGVLYQMYTYVNLASGESVTYFEPPHWDELAFGLGGILAIVLAVTLFVSTTVNVQEAPPRSPIERWLAITGVVVCFVPLFLALLLGHERFRLIYDLYAVETFVLRFGMPVFSAGFQIWYLLNRQQPTRMFVLVFGSRRALCRWVTGQLPYRRPGRP